MGKGKGTFEFWATRCVFGWATTVPLVAHCNSSRVPTGRVIFEIGGSPIREELARDGAFVLLPNYLSTKRLSSSTSSG